MSGIKKWLYEIVFEADTREGKIFDVVLIALIGLSIILVLLESVPHLNVEYGKTLKGLEWFVTVIFTLEYILRLAIVPKPRKFVFSFYGIVDLLAVLPTYLGLFLTGTQGLMVIRALRLLRIFRVMKLNRYTSEGNFLLSALKASRYKISVFLYFVLMLVIILGAVIYLVEGEKNGFTSIPKSMYWVVVTITTVGYGDITPQTTMGQFIASFIMILGYAIIAVPTGIVSAEMRKKPSEKQKSTQVCPACLKEDHDSDAQYCKHCSARLN